MLHTHRAYAHSLLCTGALVVVAAPAQAQQSAAAPATEAAVDRASPHASTDAPLWILSPRRAQVVQLHPVGVPADVGRGCRTPCNLFLRTGAYELEAGSSGVPFVLSPRGLAITLHAASISEMALGGTFTALGMVLAAGGSGLMIAGGVQLARPRDGFAAFENVLGGVVYVAIGGFAVVLAIPFLVSGLVLVSRNQGSISVGPLPAHVPLQWSASVAPTVGGAAGVVALRF